MQTLASPMSQAVTIYAMVDWNNPEVVRYVGKTQEALRKRLATHIQGVHRHRCPKNDWLKHLFLKGSFPVMLPLEVCDSDIWEAREKFWIAELRKQFPLLNVANGGDCGPSRKGCKMPPRVVEKHRQRMIGTKHNARQKATLLKSNRERNFTPELRAKMSSSSKRMLSERPNHLAFLKQCLVKAQTANIGKKRPQHVIDAVVKATRKPVRCIETGIVFPSLSSAGRSVGSEANSIWQSMKTGCASKGFHWERVQ